jgi:hypothetical protein
MNRAWSIKWCEYTGTGKVVVCYKQRNLRLMKTDDKCGEKSIRARFI